MSRSKSGFRLPGDCSEMRLPCLWKDVCRTVHMLLLDAGYGWVVSS